MPAQDNLVPPIFGAFFCGFRQKSKTNPNKVVPKVTTSPLMTRHSATETSIYAQQWREFAHGSPVGGGRFPSLPPDIHKEAFSYVPN